MTMLSVYHDLSCDIPASTHSALLAAWHARAEKDPEDPIMICIMSRHLDTAGAATLLTFIRAHQQRQIIVKVLSSRVLEVLKILGLGKVITLAPMGWNVHASEN
jgi:ABC-type transporter Mla MlaB component